MPWITLLTLALIVAVGVIAVHLRRVDKRLRTRLSRLESRHDHVLNLLRSVYAERARTAGEPRMPVEFRSEFGEDMFLFDLFEGRTRGRYVEVGAFDGYTFAVTYAFDAMGWDGLLIEPIPSLCEQVRAHRPHARVENVALSRAGAAGEALMRHLTGDAARDEASSHLAATDDFDTPRPRGADVETIRVPMTSMDALLDATPGPIDLAVIDVEGAELDLLNGFDLDEHRVRVVLIEDHSMGADPALIDHLSARGYRHVCWIAYNRLLVRQDEPELLDRALRLAQTPAPQMQLARSRAQST